MTLAIIFRPKLVGQLNSYMLHYQIRTTPSSSKVKREEVELAMLEIKKGINFVTPEIWAQASTHGQNAKVINMLTTKGALSIYTPDVENPVGSTSDFTDLAIVSEILRYTTDKEWISRSISRDTREEVFRMGSERIKDIQEDLQSRRQGNLSMELV